MGKPQSAAFLILAEESHLAKEKGFNVVENVEMNAGVCSFNRHAGLASPCPATLFLFSAEYSLLPEAEFHAISPPRNAQLVKLREACFRLAMR